MTRTPRQVARLAPLFCACLLTCSAAAAARAARQSAANATNATSATSDAVARGVASYRAGDARQAVKILREAVKREAKEDFRAWLYLGLAHSAAGKPKDARQAGRRAARLLEARFWQEYKEWHAGADAASRAERESRREREAAALAEMVADLDSLLRRGLDLSNFWRAQSDGLRFYARTAAEPERTVYTAAEVTTRARLVEKPWPPPPDGPVGDKDSGTVKLRVLLRADGSVGYVIVLEDPSDVLTDRAVEAARRVKFVPAQKDGRAVSQWLIMEYNFFVY